MSSAPISNAADRLLSANTGTMPDVSGGILDYFQPMFFVNVNKTIVNFKVVEVAEPIEFWGLWQPFTDQQLNMVPEGQRSWSWFEVHAQPGLQLLPDQVITYLDIQYRVMSKTDYRLNGYVKYSLILDYTGAGPT